MCNLEPAARNRAAPGKTRSGGPLSPKAQMAGAGCRRRNVERVSTRISHEAGAETFGRGPRPVLGISCGGTGRGLSLSPSPLLPGRPLYKPKWTQSHGPRRQAHGARGRVGTGPRAAPGGADLSPHRVNGTKTTAGGLLLTPSGTPSVRWAGGHRRMDTEKDRRTGWVGGRTDGWTGGEAGTLCAGR